MWVVSGWVFLCLFSGEWVGIFICLGGEWVGVFNLGVCGEWVGCFYLCVGGLFFLMAFGIEPRKLCVSGKHSATELCL